jgi:sec-independent protein translocase protein TatB
MFDFAWSEVGLIVLVAVVVLGPKELPQAMRALGRFTRQARKLAGEFQAHVNDLIREAEIDDIKKSVNQVTSVNVGAEIQKIIDPANEVGPELDEAITKAQQEMRVSAPAPTPEAPPHALPSPPQDPPQGAA